MVSKSKLLVLLCGKPENRRNGCNVEHKGRNPLGELVGN